MTEQQNTTEKKKILYLITKGNFGGAQRYVFDLATNLKSEHDVVVACGEGEFLQEKLASFGIRTIKLKSLKRDVNIFREILAFFEIIKIIRAERPDIIHINSSKAGALGSIAARVSGVKKIIFTGHGWAFNEDRSPFSKALIAFIHWLTIVFSHTTIAVSQKVKDQIERFPLIKGKIVHIYNGIDDIAFHEKGFARKELAPDLHERCWIGTISELHKNKGLDFLIKAFAEIEDVSDTVCIIIGEGEERKALEKLIDENDLKNKVFLVGFKKDAAKYLKAFDVFTLTSRTEAFPYVPLEAGMAALPVLSSFAGGIPEIIANGESGILTKIGDISEIRSGLESLIKNDKKRKEFGENLNKTVNKKFSLNKMLEKTLSIYFA